MSYDTDFLSEKIRQAIVILFNLMVLIVPLVWTAPTFELFEYPKMMLTYGFALLITTLWLSRVVLNRKLIWRSNPFTLPLGLFLLSQTLSTLFSIDRHTSLWGYYSRFNGGLVSVVTYLSLFGAAISNLNRKNLQNLLTTLIVTGVIVSLYAFPEHFGHSPSCQLISGQFNATCWVQDVQTRVFGTFGQPNWLAAYLITIIFIPFGRLLQSKQESTKPNLKTALYTLALMLFFTVLLFTKSRSGLLGFALGTGIFSLLALYRSKSRSRQALSLTLLTVGLFAIFSLFGRGIVPAWDNWLNTLQPTTETPAPPPPVSGTQLEVGGTESSKIRQIVWRGAIDVFKKYPLFGSGTETFGYSYYGSRPAEHNLVSEWDFLYNKAHNEFLNYLATTGLFGLGTYLFIMAVFTLICLKHIFAAKKRHTYTVIALLSGFWALAVSNFFGFSTVPVSTFFFLFPAFLTILLLKEPSDLSSSPPPDTLTWIGLSLLFLGAFLGFYRLGLMFQADTTFALGKRYQESGDLAQGIKYQQEAIGLINNEPVYTDQLSLALAQAAAALAADPQSKEQAAQLTQTAHALSNRTIQLNRVHVNFYKTRARVFILLAQIDGRYVGLAQQTLKQALELSPTDAKLWYNLGLLHDQLDDLESAEKLYLHTLELKPNYEAARVSLAQLYERLNKPQAALDQYRYILDNLNPSHELALQKFASLSAQTPSPLQGQSL